MSGDHGETPPPTTEKRFEITASIAIPPREYAKTHFTETARTGRSLRAKLRSLRSDGYECTVRLPSGRVLPGGAFPSEDLMDDDHGYGPKPEYADRVTLLEGAWVLVSELDR